MLQEIPEVNSNSVYFKCQTKHAGCLIDSSSDSSDVILGCFIKKPTQGKASFSHQLLYKKLPVSCCSKAWSDSKR